MSHVDNYTIIASPRSITFTWDESVNEYPEYKVTFHNNSWKDVFIKDAVVVGNFKIVGEVPSVLKPAETGSITVTVDIDRANSFYGYLVIDAGDYGISRVDLRQIPLSPYNPDQDDINHWEEMVTAVGEAKDTAEAAQALSEDAADDAIGARTGAEAARDQAEVYADVAAGLRNLFPTTAAALGDGLTGYTALIEGSGGTDGVYDLVLTGGTEVVAARGSFLVSGGVVTGILVTSPGYYSSAPTGFDFSASSGLTGASATPVLTANTSVGEYFTIPSASGTGFVDLYEVTAGPVATSTGKTLPNAGAIEGLYSFGGQVFINGTVVFDRSTRTVSFPEIAVRNRKSASSDGSWTPSGTNTWDAVFTSSATLLYLDLNAPAGTNPLVIGPGVGNTVPVTADRIPLGYFWQRDFVGFLDFNIQRTHERDKRVQQVASNLPVVLVLAEDAATYGVTAGSEGAWMVPLTTRWTSLAVFTATIANAASTAVDPTGTYDWSKYAQINFNNGAESLLYLDPGDNTVKTATNTAFVRGTKAGWVPLAIRHSGSESLVTLSGLECIHAGKDPDALFSRMDAAEAALDAISSGGSTTMLSSGERLRRTVKKLAILADGGSTVIRICAGPCDSWWDRPYAGAELLARFAADGIAMSSSGYINLNPDLAKSNGVTITQGDGLTALNAGAAPWTHEDADSGAGNGQLSGSGNALSTTATDRTFLASNIKAETIHLTYHDTGTGAFRYRINGGAWTTVTMANTNNPTRIQIASGLAGAANTVEIDTTVNTAGQTVRLLDIYADGTAAGVQFNQMANASSTAADWDGFKAAWVREITAMDIDLAIFGLGVNDQRQGDDPAAFGVAMQGMLDDFKMALSNSEALLVCPPRCTNEGTSGTSSMQAFGAQYSALYAENDFTDIIRYDTLWGTFAQESASPSAFEVDGSHLNDNANSGGYKRYIGAFYDRMLRRFT